MAVEQADVRQARRKSSQSARQPQQAQQQSQMQQQLPAHQHFQPLLGSADGLNQPGGSDGVQAPALQGHVSSPADECVAGPSNWGPRALPARQQMLPATQPSLPPLSLAQQLPSLAMPGSAPGRQQVGTAPSRPQAADVDTSAGAGSLTTFVQPPVLQQQQEQQHQLMPMQAAIHDTQPDAGQDHSQQDDILVDVMN